MELSGTLIIAGFTDIKTELRARAGIQKSMQELKLWFTYSDDILCVHDFSDHARNIILASYDERTKKWRNYMPVHLNGYKLVDYFTIEYRRDEMAYKVNKLYKSYGYFTSFRLK